MPRISTTLPNRQNPPLWRLPAVLLAALLLAVLLLTGLAAAAPAALTVALGAALAPALLPGQAITSTTSTSTILPEIPAASGLPAPGRTRATAEIPDWVADLLLQGGAEGVSNGQVIVLKRVESGLAADGQAVNGGLITYAISVTNNTTATIRNISLLDVLPRGALQEPIECIPNVACEKIVETQEIPEPLGGTILVTETRQISWTIASVAPGTSAVRRFRGRLLGQTDGSVLKNQAFATYEANGLPQAVSSNETQTIVKVDALLGAGATMARAATWFSSDRGGTLSLDWGDFDRDGDLDLALGSSVGTTIYRNEGGRLRLFWANARRSYGVYWGDFNGDGTLELVAVGDGSTEGLNYVYTIAGTSVQESTRFTSSHPFVRAALGDYDRDGDLDLILSTNAINAACPVQMYKNSNGAFTRPSDANGGCVSSRATAALVPGDVDNDGDLDLVLGLFPNSVQLFVNDGTGLFPLAQHRTIDGSVSFLPYHFAWGDFDGDGYLDLAAAYPLLRQARIYRNLGGSSFSTFATLRTDRFLTPFSLDWGDFTGDGLLDLAVANLSPLIYEQTPAGFVKRSQLTVDNVRGQIWSLRGVDLDGDGDLDLAVSNRDGPSLIFTNFAPVLQSTLTPVPATTVITGSRATAPAASVAWGDLNSDGLADLVLGAGPASAGPNALSTKLYYNTRAVFNRNDEIVIGGFGPHALALADVNNDSAVDLAVGTSQGTSVYLAGALTTPAWSSNAPHVATTALAWGDYDDDQDLDLLVASSDGPLRLYRNRRGENAGLLTSDPIWTSTESANSTALAWADLNGDNFLDFVVANEGQPNRIYLNQRSLNSTQTNFAPLAWPVTAGRSRAVAWGDYDGDGDVDLAVGNYSASNHIYENRGVAGGLPLLASTPIWVSSETSKTTALAWGDWDNDGDLDLAVGNDGELDQVYVNRRDPAAPTSSVQLAWLWSSATAQRTSGVAWGDVDNDGDLDLAVSQLGDSRNGYNGYYENTTIVAAHLQDEYRSAIPLVINPAYLAVDRPGGTGAAALYAAPVILSGPKHPTVTVPFRIYDPDGIRNIPGSNGIGTSIPITRLNFEYSLDDGGLWQRATGVLSNTSSVGSATSQEFTGVGPQTTALFGLTAGTAKFELKYDGTTLFTVWLLDAQGNLSGLLAEKVGAYDGTAQLNIPADGSYRLRVVGNGQWSIKIQTSVAASLGFVTPTRLGQSYSFIWNAQADAAISENARFRIGLVQGDSVGPVNQASTAAVSPPFRVRGTTCVWPQGLNFRLSKQNPNPQEIVAFTGLLLEGTGVMTFTWDFGDGSALVSGQRVNHAYYYGGEYTVRVTATGAACPRGRPTTISGKVKIGGAAPIFLPFISAQRGSRSGSPARLLLAPGAVEQLSGQLQGDSLQLSWSAPTAGGSIQSYRVYASREGGAFEPIGVTAGDGTGFTVRGPFCGAAYLVAPLGPGGEGPGSSQSYLAPACENAGGSQ